MPCKQEERKKWEKHGFRENLRRVGDAVVQVNCPAIFTDRD